jgi:hypothetical protein
LEIKAGQDGNELVDPSPVKYSIERIAGTGFTLTGDMIAEIEKTMEVCEAFTK